MISNINLKEILESKYEKVLEDTLNTATGSNPAEEPASCFVTLKEPEEKPNQNNGRFALSKDNLYKIKVIQTIWKANYAYLV